MTYPNYSKTLAVLFATVAVVLGACGTKSESSDGSCSPGGELCACTSSGGCDDGLVCATNLNQCVHLASDTGSGGATASGGSTGSGGMVSSGGTTGAGGRAGAAGTGGAAGSTGTGGHGGMPGTGGAAGSAATGTGGRGGTTGTGGAATGGATATGGRGGATGTGGAATGGATGTGGATSTACGTLTPSASGNGEFTHYVFSTGTPKGELGDYQTACGYLGTESNGIDTVMNVASTSPAKASYFAAIPGDNGFNTKVDCGACVQISNAGHTVVATIIDECPYGNDTNQSNPNDPCQMSPTGELDLSIDAFNALQFPNGNPSGTSWKVVPCPVTGNVVVRIKQVNEVYIENVILALKSVSGPGGSASRTSYGSWHFNSNVGSGSQLTLTDAADRSIMVTLNSGATDQNQDTGKQFPACM